MFSINKRLSVDIHVHTIASGHAFSTISELCSEAGKHQVRMVGIADHGPSMQGAPHLGYFRMRPDIREIKSDCELLFGCEANIISVAGNIDLPQNALEELDYFLVGLHNYTPYSEVQNSTKNNTNAIVNCIQKIKPLAISHPIHPGFKVEIEPIISVAQFYGVALEINNRVLNRYSSEVDVVPNTKKLIEFAMERKVKLLISSDCHYCGQIGDISSILKWFPNINETADSVINNSTDTLKKELFKDDAK
ncbi:MAG: hypothetical protein CL609_22895 [Anaerolineaceae bacterium]|nr:hypothetical protein [Anaerolineaceae bacterium]